MHKKQILNDIEQFQLKSILSFIYLISSYCIKKSNPDPLNCWKVCWTFLFATDVLPCKRQVTGHIVKSNGQNFAVSRTFIILVPVVGICRHAEL